jgi:hypothetical protein
MELALIEDVDQQRHGVSAAGNGGPDYDIVGDPDAPGISVAEIRNRSQPQKEPLNDQNDRQGRKSGKKQEGRR